jgi:prephenate dehydrogenase
MKIAIIGGAGKMGRWLADFFSDRGYNVAVFDLNQKALRRTSQLPGITVTASLSNAVSGADYIILSVPIEAFESAVKELSAVITPGQAVIDITSVKSVPVAAMHRLLPRNTALGGHPLFGPGAKDLSGKNVILTPTNEAENAFAGRVKAFLEKKGARVGLMSPAEHDEIMSVVLGLSHFISLVAADTLLSAGKKLRPMAATGSSTYKVLLTLIESVLSEDPELYASIQTNLPSVTRYESLFREKTGEWADLVAARDRREFVRRMKTVKAKLVKSAPDFEKSYEKMYRIVEGL